MRLSRALAPLVLAATLAACGGSTPADLIATPAASAAQLPDSVRVSRLEPVTLDGGRLTVSFTDLADSRCPANVVCAWEGDAAATLRLDARGAVATPVLHTRLEPKRVVHAGYEVTLLHVEPYPGTEPENARVVPTAVLKVTRR